MLVCVRRLIRVVGLTYVLIVLSLAACGMPGQTIDPATDAPPEGGFRSEEPPPEQRIVSLYKGDATSDANASEIIRLLPSIDWRVYDKASKGGSFDLLTWLYNRNLTDVNEIACVLGAIKGLDGALTEQHSNIAGKTFSNAPLSFVKALATLPRQQIDDVTFRLAYYASYDDPSRFRALAEALLEKPDLTARARELVANLVTSLK